MAIMTVITVVIMIPRHHRAKVWGYVNLFDAVSTFYVMSHFAATGSVTGLIVGIAAILGLTFTLRVGRAFFRSEKLSIDGSSTISDVVAGGFTQSVKWVRGITSAIFNGGYVNKPQPLNWAWTTDLEKPDNLWDGARRLATIL
jgi:hypothetical protein